MKDQTRRHFAPDESTLPDETRIRALLEEILETDVSPEHVSGGDLVLERELRKRLIRARSIEAQLEAMFPHDIAGENPVRSVLLENLRNEARLPDIQGYEVHSVIGAGGMGVVYRARHLKLNRWVAIKMVLLGVYASRQDLECLLREAQNVAALRHPNIVQVYDVAEHDGFPFYAMELLEGGDLSQTIRGKPRAAHKAADLIRELAGAVHAAHLGGIVHRDLKPGNILLNSDETPKIGDFSLATRLDRDSTIMTNARQGGTPSYMAPEQAVGDANAIQPTVDIYALGAVLYELLTGRPPFMAETSAQTRQQVITEDPVPPSRLNSRIPFDLQTICLKCLQKDPARRYESAADLADDLERFKRGEPILARPVGATERTLKWCRRRPATTLAIAFSVLAITGVIAGGIWLQRLEHARHTETVLRREGARTSIESALPLLSQFVKSRQWSDAAGVLSTAQARLSDADLPELERRVAAAADEFEVAQELDRIRQSFPEHEPGDKGYTDRPTRDSYARIFRRLGIGSDVEVETAAARVRESPLRESILAALDHAAFTERFSPDHTELTRLLAVGRASAPNSWQDRFRNPYTWQELASLQELVKDAPNAEPAPPSHQIVMIGILLSGLEDYATTIEILRAAQLRDPADFWVNLELGHTLRRAGKPGEAVQYLRVATAQKPAHFVGWTELGGTLYLSGKLEDAIPPLRMAIAIQPELPVNWVLLINSLGVCGQWEEALAIERAAAAAIPNFVMPADTLELLHLCRGRVVALKREWLVAAEAYSQALDGGYVNNADLWFEFAAVSELAGDAPGYRKICASMLERCESANLRRFLVARACTLAEVSDQELTQAANWAMPELDRYTNHYWSLTERAALLCREGRHREALPLLEKSLQSSSEPKHAIITWSWLARTHLSLGDHDAARLWLGKVAACLDQSTGKPAEIHLHNWLETQILCREVEAELAL